MRGRIGKTLLLAVISGVLIFLGTAEVAAPWRRALLRAASPALTVTSRRVLAAREFLGGFSGNRVRALEEERARLLARLAEREAIREENDTLRAVLALRKDGEAGAVPAEAIAFFRDGHDEYLMLNRGTADGIGIGDIVVNRERVLGGTVVSVDVRTARAILFTSPSRSIDVSIPSANLRAIARGANAREFAIELVPSDAPVHAGDLVLASSRATGGRPLALGEIREARQAERELFKTVRATHLFDPADPAVIVLLAP